MNKSSFPKNRNEIHMLFYKNVLFLRKIYVLHWFTVYDLLRLYLG